MADVCMDLLDIKLLYQTSNPQTLHLVFFIFHSENYPGKSLHIALHDGFMSRSKPSDGALWGPVPLNPGFTPGATIMPLLTELGFADLLRVVVEF